MVIAADWKQTLRWPKLTLPDYWKGRSTVQSLLTRLLQAFTEQSRGKYPVALPDFWDLFLGTKGRVNIWKSATNLWSRGTGRERIQLAVPLLFAVTFSQQSLKGHTTSAFVCRSRVAFVTAPWLLFSFHPGLPLVSLVCKCTCLPQNLQILSLIFSSPYSRFLCAQVPSV